MTTRKRIIRAAHNSDNPYVMIMRAIPQDKSLSWEARGILCYLLSQRDDWKLQVDDLKQNCGEHTVYRVLKELKKAGYIVQERHRNDKGKYVYGDYLVYEYPRRDFQDVDNPDVDNPNVENRDDLINSGSGINKKDSAPADAGAAGDGEILNQPTSKNEEKSSHSDTTASGDTQEPPSSATPPKQKRQRKPNPLFDPIYNAIEHGFWEIEDSAGAFSPDDDKDNGGRISKVAWWHCGKSYKGVRTIGNPATLDTVQMHVEAIKKFATWVRAKGITIHDIAKYVEWYGKWVSEVKMQSQRRQSKAVHAPARPVLTDEQRAENLRKLQEARDAALNTDKEAV
jgi:hypothetical protein